MADLLKISVPGKPEYVSTVRMTISALAHSAGFDVEDIEDIKVAVSEACTNVVRHGKSEQNDYDVFCELSEDRLMISVADHAGGYDTACYCMPEPENPREGGMGIFVIRALMDEVDIFSEIGFGTRIQMIKYFHK